MTVRSPPLFSDIDVSLDHAQGHILIAGNSGSGKTGALCLIARHKLRNPATGFLLADPDGEISPHCAEYLANPDNGLQWRKVHYLKPASATETFALPLLDVPDRSPQLCHDKTVRAITIFEQAVTVGAGDYGPRLQKFFYLGALGLALTGRPLVDLPDVYGNAAHLRQTIAGAYPYPFLRDAMEAVDLLSDRAVMEYKDPLISRLLPIFGNARLRRVFGPQTPVSITNILRNREAAFLDLSGMEHKDAVLVGKAFLSLVYHEALQRDPNREPHTCAMLDEGFDYLSTDIARGFDRLRKRNVQLCIAIQRFSQMQRAGDDDAAAIMSAALSGTNTKMIFRLPEPDDADLMTNLLFRGFVNLEEWKEGSARPTAIGNTKEIVRSRSRAEHEAEHHTEAHTTSSTGGRADGTMTSTSSAIGSFDGVGDGAGMVMAPPAQLFGPNAPNASAIPYALSTSTNESKSHGESEQSGTSHGESHVDIEMHGEADTIGHGTSKGVSVTEGESETFVTEYALLPTTMFSLQEQLHRLAGEIQNLAHRECFVKIQNQKPVRTRTRDLEPSFKSGYGRRVFLPLFHKLMLARSGYLFPVAEVDAQIAARLKTDEPTSKPPPDFSPAPMPHVLTPVAFANAFHAKRAPTKPASPKAKHKKPRPGRRPQGELDERHSRFSVIDGDGAGDNEPTK